MSLLYTYRIYIVFLLESEFHPQIGNLKFSGRIFIARGRTDGWRSGFPLTHAVPGLSILNELLLDGEDQRLLIVVSHFQNVEDIVVMRHSGSLARNRR